ncbi:MAG: LemA family protein [Fimbriimonadales bacterium]|nr:LemA family protein [Fimbriimonadales bacterium]
MDGLWIAAVLLGAALAYGISRFNRLVYLRQLTRNAWSDISVHLNRRADLVPNIVEAVRAYARHEQGALEAVSQARAQALAAKTPSERSAAEGRLGSGLERALVLAEAYPELKASANFLQLQAELTETEDAIANARKYYNACVRDYNTAIETFPSSLFAALGGFRPAEFFEPERSVEQAPRVEA